MSSDGGPAAASIDPVFTVVRPVGAAGPFVFASPHSGGLYPDDMGADPALAEASLRSAEDTLVDQLIAGAADYGIPVIAGRVGRAYLDLNRGADEQDPLLVEGLTPAEASAKTAAGYGVLPRLTGDGASLYSRLIDAGEAAERVRRVHAPYHAALARLMEEARQTHGRAVLVDWHSMPGRAGGIDVVLGDRHGTSCRAVLTRRLKTLFERQGWTVALNHPYAGGYSTRTWGRPADGFEAVQVEISRALYLDPVTRAPGIGYGRCRAAVAQVIAALADPAPR